MQQNNNERTFLMLKPDAVQRGLIGKIIQRFENKGFKLVALKFVKAPEKLVQEHYKEHDGKPFFNKIVTYIASGPVVPMVWEGKNVIETARKMMGATNPQVAGIGTIRGDFGIDTGRNVIHGSDGQESAKREISIWFKEEELCDWNPSKAEWIYEQK